jgi:hypothetical protein
MLTPQIEGTSKKKLIISDIRAAVHTQMTVNSFTPTDRQIESMFSTPQQIKSFAGIDMLFICFHIRPDRIWETASSQFIGPRKGGVGCGLCRFFVADHSPAIKFPDYE